MVLLILLKSLSVKIEFGVLESGESTAEVRGAKGVRAEVGQEEGGVLWIHSEEHSGRVHPRGWIEGLMELG